MIINTMLNTILPNFVHCNDENFWFCLFRRFHQPEVQNLILVFLNLNSNLK